jgi:hypothetical protein
MKKKLTLKEAFLAEKDTSVDQANKELGGFKSLLHGDKKDKKPAQDLNKVNDELKGAKWEMSESSFDLDQEDAFSDSFEQQMGAGGSKQQDLNQLDEPFHEAHCEQNGPCDCGGIVPVDALERVSITIHPGDENGEVLHDNEYESNAGTFAAPGGPSFGEPEVVHNHEPINDAVDPIEQDGNAPSVVDDGGLANLEAYLQDIEDEMAGRTDSYPSDFKNDPNKMSSYKKEAVDPVKENVNRLKKKLSESLKKKI